MVEKSRTFPYARFVLAVLAVLAVVVLAAALLSARDAWQRNWRNMALTQAAFAAEPAAMFDWSSTAIAGYTAVGDQPQTQERLLDAYQLRWRSAAQVGNLDEGLAAFEAGHNLAADNVLATACTPTTGVLEAEEFAGIQADSLVIPTAIEGREAVLLFSTQPISQAVCLEAAGIYTLAVTAAVLGPPPVHVEANWDGWPAGLFVYTEVGVLRVAETQIVAPAGAHTLSLTLANDFSDPATGVDRNVIIESVRLTRDMATDEQQD